MVLKYANYDGESRGFYVNSGTIRILSNKRVCFPLGKLSRWAGDGCILKFTGKKPANLSVVCTTERERGGEGEEERKRVRGERERESSVLIFTRSPSLPTRNEAESDRQISRVFLKERGPGGWNAGAASHGARPGGARCTAWIYTRTYPRANTYSVNLSSAHTWRRREHRDRILSRTAEL